MTEVIWRQISCQKAVSGDDFERGVQDYSWSVGSPSSCLISKSYFKVDVTLNEYDGAGALIKPTNVVFAENAPSCMYNNVYFRAGGQDVSSLVNYVGQVQQAKTRLQKTFGWQRSIGRAAFGIEADPAQRVGVLTQNVVSFLWQPPIGIFDHDEPLGAGDYRIQLNPNTGYKKAMVEGADRAVGTAANQYDVVINSVQFFVCTVKTSIPMGISTLHLLECLAQSKTKAAGDSNLEFTVPASTRALTIFVQAGAAGSNNVVPPTKFIAVNGSQNNLQSLQLTYANVSKPATRWGSAFDADTDQVQQRYLETQMESGLVMSQGGAETYDDYKERGWIVHSSFAKDELDKSTQVQLSMNIPTLEANANVFVLAWYSRATQITTTNGYVSDIQSLNV